MPGPLSREEYARREAIWLRMSAISESWHSMAKEAGINQATFAEWARRHMPGAKAYRTPRVLTPALIKSRMVAMAENGYATWRIARSVHMSVDKAREFAAQHGIDLNDFDQRRLSGVARRIARQKAYKAELRRQSEEEARAAVKPTMQRNCLRCESNFLSERADGAWLRMCPYCRGLSYVGQGMEGATGRQVRGRAA